MINLNILSVFLFFTFNLVNGKNNKYIKYYNAEIGEICDNVAVKNEVSLNKLNSLNENSDCKSGESLKLRRVCIKGKISFNNYINISFDGRCGKELGVCPFNQCCNLYGYCGYDSSYCQAGCQSEFGACDQSHKVSFYQSFNEFSSENNELNQEENSNEIAERAAKNFFPTINQYNSFINSTKSIMDKYTSVIKNITINFDTNFNINKCKIECNSFFNYFKAYIKDKSNLFDINTLNEILKNTNEKEIHIDTLYNSCLNQ